MTNAHSKYSDCRENFPWPHLPKKQEMELVGEAIREQSSRTGRLKKSQCWTYDIGWSYDLDRWVIDLHFHSRRR